MALEVNFYAGTRQDYKTEDPRDRGGLYALIDGTGLYRGHEPIAGPAPIDIRCNISRETVRQNNTTYTGNFDCDEDLDKVFALFATFSGSGSRPVRVYGITEDSNRHLIMFNSKMRDDGALEFVQAELAEAVPDDADIDSVSSTIYKLIITIDNAFTLIKIDGRLSVSNISARTLEERITEVEETIIAISNHAVIRDIVEELPTANIDLNTIYMIYDPENNVYVEWMYINSKWKQIGTTDVNLADYVPYTVYNELVARVEVLEETTSWTTMP